MTNAVDVQNFIDGTQWSVGSARRANESLLKNGNFEGVADNLNGITWKEIDTGTIYWRMGKSPLDYYSNAYLAYEEFDVLSKKLNLDMKLSSFNRMAAVACLLGKPFNVNRLELDADNRGLSYSNALDCALHDSDALSDVLSIAFKYMEDNDELVEQSYKIYLQLLDIFEKEHDIKTLIVMAEENWIKRKNCRYYRSFTESHGYGKYNDMFLDIDLAAVCKKMKIDYNGLHAWRW